MVYRNFYIDPVKISEDGINEAEGVVFKYKDQLVINKKKSQKAFQSIKCKKSMKLNKDFVMNLTVKKAYSRNDEKLSAGQMFLEKNVPVIPAGCYGTFELKIQGINNYRGTLIKTIYVTEKAYLMKNAKIKLGKNLKSVTFVNGGVRLTPAYYDVNKVIQYVTDAGTFKEVFSLDDAFMVFMGKDCLSYSNTDAGGNYTISYKNNDKVGTATLIIEGKGKYMGTKSVNFKVTGAPFTAKTVSFNKFHDTMTYTGEECRQDDMELTDMNGTVINPSCYTVSYKNNVKKGTASMTVTADPKMGYKGKVKKSYKITAADIAMAATVVPVDGLTDKIEPKGNGAYHLDGIVTFKKDGAKPSDRILLLLNVDRENPITLVENKDYTVKFADNMSTTPGTTPTIIITGKGNFTGTLTVTFNISKTPLQSAENLSVKITAVAYKEKNQESYQYQPKIKVSDGKKTLKEGTDYTISEYVNCTQKDVKAYLDAKNNATERNLQLSKPYIVITAADGSDYSGSMNVDLSIYDTKITARTLYVVIVDDADHSQTTYTGAQIRPKVEVYYGAAKTVKEAKKAKIADSAILTDESGTYKLTKLEPGRGDNSGDYTLEYGVNIKAGKNAGSVSVIGIGRYGGNVKTKFTILGDDVFGYQVEPWSLFADKMRLIFAQ